MFKLEDAKCVFMNEWAILASLVLIEHEKLNMWMKLKYILILNVLLITDSLGLHKICILKKTIISFLS